MKLIQASVRSFRRLEDISIEFEESESLGQDWDAELNHEAEYREIYEAVRSPTFKKTEFALSVASSKAEWITPKYIADGLKWLAGELQATSPIISLEADA